MNQGGIGGECVLEDLARMFEQASQEGGPDQAVREERMAALLKRALGPVGAEEEALRDAWAPPDYVFNLRLPYYHQAATLLVQRKEALARALGLTPMQAYTLLLKTAAERGISPDRLASRLAFALDREG